MFPVEDGDRKKAGEMRVRPRFSVDGCGQNSRLLWVFNFLGVKDLTHVIIHHADSAGLPLSPPLFFGLPDEPLVLAALEHLADAPGLRRLLAIFRLHCSVVGVILAHRSNYHCGQPPRFFSSYKSTISASTSTIAASIASIRVKVRQLPVR